LFKVFLQIDQVFQSNRQAEQACANARPGPRLF
jgi:hypothetical protein